MFRSHRRLLDHGRFAIALIALLALPLTVAAQANPPMPLPEVQALLDKGKAAQVVSQSEEALRWYNEALEKSRTLGDKVGEGNTLRSIGNVYADTGKFQQALASYQQALTVHRQVDNKVGEARTLGNIGLVYRIIGPRQKALEFLEQALTLFRQAGNTAGEADTLTNIGLVYADMDQPQKALGLYEQALPLHRQAGNKENEARTLMNAGNAYRDIGQPQKALKMYQEALTLHRLVGNQVSQAMTLGNMGTVYHDIGQREKALAVYEEALAMNQRVGNPMGEAATLANIGNIYSEMGKPQKALEFLQQALPLYQQSGNISGEALTRSNLGSVYNDIGQPQKALEFLEQALTLHRRIGNITGAGNALMHIGRVYSDTSQPEKALTSFREALALHRQVGNKTGEADTLGNMGLVYSATGRFQRALELYQQALPLYQRMGNQASEANALANTGSVYLDIGQFQEALTLYLRALPLYRKAGDTVGEAAALTNVGIVHNAIGQPQMALSFLEQALTLHRQTGGALFEANTLGSLGSAYSHTDHPQKALTLYQQALTLYRQVGDTAGEANILSNMGLVYNDLGQPEKALELYRQALPLHRQAGNKVSEAKALGNIAAVQEQRGRLDEAEQSLKDAVAVLERVREGLGGLSEAKVSYLTSGVPTYHRYIHILLKRGKPADAFAVAQKVKARALLDLMASGRVDIGQHMTAAERQQEQTLRVRASFLSVQMAKEGVQNEVGAKKRFAALRTQLVRAERDLQAFTDDLYTRHPVLARQRAARTATLADIARFLPEDTALLEYVVLGTDTQSGTRRGVIDETVLFVVTNKAGKAVLRTYSLPVRSAALTEKTDALRAACADPRQPYQEATREMYRLLLPPAAVRQMAGRKRLLVCPDGPLWNVPFAVLHDGRRFLLERYELACAYSATGAQATLLARTEKKRAKPTATLLALGNPDFGGGQRFGDNVAVAGQRPIDSPSRRLAPRPRPIDSPSRPLDSPSRAVMWLRGGGIAPLPGTGREARALHRRVRSAGVYTGKAAQESVVKREAGRYRYVHLASHAFFNDAAPLLSSIVLARPPAGSDDDGFLTAREIFDLNLSADMVVLSACNTARGVARTGEGVVGLTWALFVAGAPTQVVSQWAVDDAATVLLMDRFYAALLGDRARFGKAGALRRAELSLLRDRKYRHPYYWAPFVLMGDWR